MRVGTPKSRRPLATLPSKQGLKPNRTEVGILLGVPLATLPSKQGLKLRWISRHDGEMLSASCYTSIKTRIETRSIRNRRTSPRQPLATLPSKQGLKHCGIGNGGVVGVPLATLPSKQGLKHLTGLNIKKGGTILLLHFHQNKD